MVDYKYIRSLGHWLHCRATVPVLDFLFLNVLCDKNKILFGLSHSEGILLHAVECNPNWNSCSRLFTTCSWPLILSYLPLFSILESFHALFTPFCIKFTAYQTCNALPHLCAFTHFRRNVIPSTGQILPY